MLIKDKGITSYKIVGNKTRSCACKLKFLLLWLVNLELFFFSLFRNKWVARAMWNETFYLIGMAKLLCNSRSCRENWRLPCNEIEISWRSLNCRVQSSSRLQLNDERCPEGTNGIDPMGRGNQKLCFQFEGVFSLPRWLKAEKIWNWR